MQSIFISKRVERGDVLLAFSARDTEQGKFTFFSVLKDVKANVIFVNDFSSNWYLDGTPDFRSEADMVRYLKERIAELIDPASGRLFTLGSSMGAYAALKFGSLLDADGVFAMGPESELCIPLGRSVTSLKGRTEGDGDISRLQYKNPAGVYVFSGSNDIVDYYCACKLAHFNPRLSVSIINNRTHVVAKYLDAKFGLANIVSSLFFQNNAEFILSAELGALSDLQLATDIKLFNEKLSAGVVDISHADSVAKAARMFQNWSMVQYFHALVQEKTGNIEGAMTSLRDALRAQSNLGRARLKLAGMLMRVNDYAGARGELEILAQSNQSYSVGSLLASACAKLGDVEAAIVTLERSLQGELTPKQRKELQTRRRDLLAEKNKDSFSDAHVALIEASRDLVADLDLKSANYADTSAQASSQITVAKLTSNKVFYKDLHHTAEITVVFQDSDNSRVYLGKGIAGRINIRVCGNNCVIYVGDGARLEDISISANQGDDLILIGNDVTAMPGNIWHASGGMATKSAALIIGDDCMFSFNVCLLSADGHPIFSPETMCQVNLPDGPVLIEPHVWVGKDVTVLKNSVIGACSVVGASSLVNGRLPRCSVSSGIPALPCADGKRLWARSHLSADIQRAQDYFERYSKPEGASMEITRCPPTRSGISS